VGSTASLDRELLDSMRKSITIMLKLALPPIFVLEIVSGWRKKFSCLETSEKIPLFTWPSTMVLLMAKKMAARSFHLTLAFCVLGEIFPYCGSGLQNNVNLFRNHKIKCTSHAT
jgi:hypothetical protein